MILEQQINKKLFFLVSLPRAGNTLLSSLINQNKEIVCTANSITLEIIKELVLLKQTDVFLNYPDHQSLNNVIETVYDIYYKDWPQRIIIDRGPVMTPANFALMQRHFRRPFKCIILVRDLMDVLASYMKWYTENPDAFPNKQDFKTDDEKLSMLVSTQGAIGKGLQAIKNAQNYPDLCHFIKYDDLVKNPEKELKSIYKFMEEPYFNHKFVNLDQININGIKYNDSIMGQNMHTIRTEEIMKEDNPYIEKIPKRIKEKYEHIRF